MIVRNIGLAGVRVLFPVCCLLTAQSLHAAPLPQVSYTALSDAARKAGQLKRYENAATATGRLVIGQYTLDYSVPKKVRAYDVIPVRYSLVRPAGERRAAVEAVAFEDPSKAKDARLYDLAIPGDLKVKIELLGSVSADYDPSKHIPLTADPKSPISPFPPIKRDPLVRSSTVRAADMVWFKIRITNTGDTILDPEGFNSSFLYPQIQKLGVDGKPEWTNGPVNMFGRQLSYIYPGESAEQWVGFWCPQFAGQGWGLREGDYLLRFSMFYKYEQEWIWGTNIWGGKDFATLEVPIKATKTGGQTPVEERFKITDTSEKMPGYLSAFEEFMTSFRIYNGSTSDSVHKDIAYLQVAPWTRRVVLKLILTDPKQIAVAKIPVKVSDETLRIKYNPANKMVLNADGKDEPIIFTQAMPGMRSGFQLGPYAEDHMLREIREMKDLGINVVANTSGGWWTTEIGGGKGIDPCSVQYKYWYDTLMRKVGMKCVGWSVYPPSAESWYTNGAPLLGKDKLQYSKCTDVYGAVSGVDLGDPIVPKMVAAWVKYEYTRWGDFWLTTADGRIPIDIEDSWGWMRDDINCRYNPGPLAVAKFRPWAVKKYGTIEAANKTWGSRFKSFDEIDPTANQGLEGDGIGVTGVFNKNENPFHDWSPATEDWDIFRTELRVEILRQALAIIHKTIPNAYWSIRTEGSNLVMKGDPTSENMHWRHVYFSQRRNATMYDILSKSGVVKYYSDYTSLPHSEYEWRQAMREMVEAGITPMFLPQFDHMRDILLNPHYGREYQTHYGLDKPSKGMMIHCLVAAYPWMKATYEEGGAPGLMWSDYLCDGFATETQKREVKLLRKYFGRMKR